MDSEDSKDREDPAITGLRLRELIVFGVVTIVVSIAFMYFWYQAFLVLLIVVRSL